MGPRRSALGHRARRPCPPIDAHVRLAAFALVFVSTTPGPLLGLAYCAGCAPREDGPFPHLPGRYVACLTPANAEQAIASHGRIADIPGFEDLLSLLSFFPSFLSFFLSSRTSAPSCRARCGLRWLEAFERVASPRRVDLSRRADSSMT